MDYHARYQVGLPYKDPPQSAAFPPASFHIVPPPPPVHRQQYQNPDAYQARYENVPPHPPQSFPPPHQAPDQVLFERHGKIPSHHAPPDPVPSDAPVTAPKPPGPPSPSLNQQALLLSLAERYLEAAHSRGYRTALARRPSELEGYYRLIAIALACLEAVLQNWRLEPRAEAAIRLRYASVVFEETENDIEAETALSKGIALCERNRLVDFKYGMQHLLARVIHRKSPKAAAKFLDQIIQDVEAYHHTSWAYAFRFLRVSLSLETPSAAETTSALQHLHAAAATANGRGDHAIFVMSAVLETYIHLRSGAADALGEAQRAIASARSQPMHELAGKLPQLVALVYIFDLACSMIEPNPNHVLSKMQTVRELLDQIFHEQRSPISAEGHFSLPIHPGPPGSNVTHPIDGLLSRSEHGSDLLEFSWMPARDLYALAYLLNGAATSHRNSQDGRKAEKALEEGLKMAGEEVESPAAKGQPLTVTAVWLGWRRRLRCYMRIQLTFVRCARTDWAAARWTLDHVRKDLSDFAASPSEPLFYLSEYLEGVILQGTGHLDAALAQFQRPALAFGAATSAGRSDSGEALRRDVSILATLNTILILAAPSRPDDGSVDRLFAVVEPWCVSHHNRNIQAAYNLIKATSHATDLGIMRKNNIQAALNAAKSVANMQLTCIALNYMSGKYFRGVVGEQAVKSSQAAVKWAEDSSNSLWASVARGMLADTLEVQGRVPEATRVRAEATDLAGRVVPGLLDASQGGHPDPGWS
ncbi:MAG: hypothetical protein M1838_003792 [Thelocarpon superellum]|nr:MAG: hypothetical protein M1838_003792 [Thelocarpon superellum]